MNNTWAMVTGATAGIGRATAEKLAQQKTNLVLTGRREERLKESVLELKNKYSVEAIDLCFDIQNVEAMKQVIETHLQTLSKVSILINNAGLAKGVAPCDQGDIEDWDLMIDTNIKGLFNMTRLMLPFLKQQPRADIVNLGSVAGRWTYPGGAVYCATKHAVLAFSEGLRKDLNGLPIRVCCIEPGMVHTEFSKVRLEDDEKAQKVYQGFEPLTAEDIADTILWSLQRPSHVNIQELVVFPTAQASVTQVHRT